MSAGTEVFSQRNPKISSSFPSYEAKAGEVDLAVVWNLDFWGKYRRQTEAARANLLASQWGQRTVLTSVISSVASAYFTLRELDLALDVSKMTLAARQDSLRLTSVLAKNGSASGLDVRQSEQLVYTAAETIPDLERQIVLQENSLSILLGRNPGPIPRGRKLTEQPNPPAIPVGLPSDTAGAPPRHPGSGRDAGGGECRGRRCQGRVFPQHLADGYGRIRKLRTEQPVHPRSESVERRRIADPTCVCRGALRSGKRLAEAQKEEMLLTYQQTIMNAFQQVSSSLTAYQKGREFREQQELLTAAAGRCRSPLENTLSAWWHELPPGTHQ